MGFFSRKVTQNATSAGGRARNLHDYIEQEIHDRQVSFFLELVTKRRQELEEVSDIGSARLVTKFERILEDAEARLANAVEKALRSAGRTPSP